MGPSAGLIEQHDHLGRLVDRGHGMGGHGRELGRLAGMNHDSPIAEREADRALEHEHPVVAGVYLRFRLGVDRLESDLDRHHLAARTRQRPHRHALPLDRLGPDHDLLVVGRRHQFVDAHVELAGKWHQHVEADGATAVLEPADRRCADSAAFGQIVERPSPMPTNRPQARSHQVVDRTTIGGRARR